MAAPARLSAIHFGAARMSSSASSLSIRSHARRPFSRLDGSHSEPADIGPRNRRRSVIPWGLVGMIGLLVAIESLRPALVRFLGSRQPELAIQHRACSDAGGWQRLALPGR